MSNDQISVKFDDTNYTNPFRTKNNEKNLLLKKQSSVSLFSATEDTLNRSTVNIEVSVGSIDDCF